VVVARERGSSVRVSEFLVDPWCLGVKNALGPKPVERRRLPSFRADAFSTYAALFRKAVIHAVMIHGLDSSSTAESVW
jgi:hypothetical protein